MFGRKLLALIFFLSFILSSFAVHAQVDQLKVSTLSEPKEGEDITLVVSPANSNLTFSKVDLYFRVPNDKYQAQEMKFDKGSYVYTIPGAQAVPPTLEYYVIGTKSDGSKVVFPYIQTENPEADVENSPAILKVRPVTSDESVSILMGEPGSSVAAEDFIIMLSYYRISETIDVASIKLLVNGQDVTSKSTVTADALTYVPEQVPGKGTMSMDFSAKLKDGTLVGPISWKTTTTTVEEAEKEEAAERNFNISGNVWDELRYEKIAGGSQGYHRANAAAAGNWYWLNYTTNIYMTSEEKSFLQPSNRYTLKLSSPYFDLGIGDVYPSFSRMVMNGTRVRGIEANLKLNWVNVDFTYGQTSRAVEAAFVEGAIIASTGSDQQKDTLEAKGYVQDGNLFRLKRSAGAYQRDLFATKLSFGNKLDGFNYGITFLKSMDDTSSNKFGPTATANIATGMDMQLILDNNRFSWYADGAFSVRNNDTRNALDSTMNAKLSDAGIPIDKINKIFPITAGIDAPLSTDLRMIMDYMAIQTGIKLNYWNNYFKAEYVRYGGSYSSDGLAFFQNDVQGIKISDRLRLLQNKLILSVGFDNLANNLAGTRDFKYAYASAPTDTVTIDGTTTKKNIRTGFAIFPGGKWPSLSFDYIRSTNNNALPDDQVAAANNLSNTFQISSSYGFSAGENFHSIGLTFSKTNKVDNRDRAVFLSKYGISPVDQTNRSIFLSYSTSFGNDMSIGGSFTNSASDYEVATQNTAFTKGQTGYGTAQKTEISFNIIEVNAVKTWWGKLKTGGRVNGTFSTNNQYVIGGNAEYAIYQNLFATYDLNYFVNTGGVDNDFITAIKLQYVF